MIYKIFHYQIYLSLLLIVVEISHLYSMQYIESDKIEFEIKAKLAPYMNNPYTKEELELLEYIFKQILNMIKPIKMDRLKQDSFPKSCTDFFPFPIKAPYISPLDYLVHFIKFCKPITSCYIETCILINRFIKIIDRCDIFNQFTFHRIFLTAFVIATKYYDDYYFSNKYYARVGGIATSHLNSLEITFLKILNFNLFTTMEEFSHVLFMLELEKQLDLFLQNLNKDLDGFIDEFKRLKIVT